MDLRYTPAEQAFRAEVRQWLADNLTGDFAHLVGAGGPGREHEHIEARKEWELRLGEGGWIGVGWPKEVGGRGATLVEQCVFHEEYAAAGAPARLSHMAEHLLGPTLILFGNEDQKKRFLPGIMSGEELWCQGYSEPSAGSDLANVATRAKLVDGKWVINGQKVWTSLAHEADWCFVVCRTDPDSKRHKGLSYLLVPMRQDGITVRPIVQITGTSEFNEVFFDDATTDEANCVGTPGDGWKVAMGTLAVERGVSTLDQQLGFARELREIVENAKRVGTYDDPAIYDRITDAWIGLRIITHHALRTLTAADPTTASTQASVAKLMWATYHRDLGELAVDVMGPAASVAQGEPYDLDDAQRLYLYTRADTIYGGSNEIQRNIVAERLLGLPR